MDAYTNREYTLLAGLDLGPQSSEREDAVDRSSRPATLRRTEALMHAHMLPEVIMPREILAAPRERALVRYRHQKKTKKIIISQHLPSKKKAKRAEGKKGHSRFSFV